MVGTDEQLIFIKEDYDPRLATDTVGLRARSLTYLSPAIDGTPRRWYRCVGWPGVREKGQGGLGDKAIPAATVLESE